MGLVGDEKMGYVKGTAEQDYLQKANDKIIKAIIGDMSSGEIATISAKYAEATSEVKEQIKTLLNK